MMVQDAIQTALIILGLPFTIYGVYYVIIGVMGLFKSKEYPQAPPQKKFAAVIAARNEAGVVGNLIDSLKEQHYPKELYDIYVLPNNCTDNTEEVALAHGAKTFHCSSAVHSKGGALEEFFDDTFAHNDIYDGFCIFDADNLVQQDFFQAMNNAMCAGVEIGQGYRESKNPKTSWVSGCQTIFYYTVNRFINQARQNIGLSAALNGTGFMVSAKVLKKDNSGFRTFSLTEDIEFTTQNIIKGQYVSWVPDARTYDEHPIDFKTSWKQRKRWSTGTIQCFSYYTPKLWQSFKETHRFGCIDMILYLSAPLLQVISTIYSFVSFIIIMMISINLQIPQTQNYLSIAGSAVGILLTIQFTHWLVRHEHHKNSSVKTSSYFTWWFFIVSWTVINFACILKPLTTWEPIAHTESFTLSQLKSNLQIENSSN